MVHCRLVDVGMAMPVLAMVVVVIVIMMIVALIVMIVVVVQICALATICWAVV